MDDNDTANIHLALVVEVLSSVVEKKIAKDTRDTLTKLYESKSLHNKIFFKKRLYTFERQNQVSDWPNQHNKNFICITHYVGWENRVK